MKKKQVSKPPIETEYEVQCRVFRTARSYATIYPELRFLTGSLSGIKMTIGQAVKMKKAGCLVKGIPDLHLPLRRGGWNSLWIEIKRDDGGKISQEQYEWSEFLKKQGFKHRFTRGFQETWDEIFLYLEG